MHTYIIIIKYINIKLYVLCSKDVGAAVITDRVSYVKYRMRVCDDDGKRRPQ